LTLSTVYVTKKERERKRVKISFRRVVFLPVFRLFEKRKDTERLLTSFHNANARSSNMNQASLLEELCCGHRSCWYSTDSERFSCCSGEGEDLESTNAKTSELLFDRHVPISFVRLERKTTHLRMTTIMRVIHDEDRILVGNSQSSSGSSVREMPSRLRDWNS